MGTLQRELAKLPAERKRVLDTHQEGYIEWTEAKTRLDDIKERQAELEEEQDRLEARLTTNAADREHEVELRTPLQRFGRRLANLAPTEKMLVIRGFIQRVTVAPDGGVTLDAYLSSPGTSTRTRGNGQYIKTAWPIPHARLVSASRPPGAQDRTARTAPGLAGEG